MQKKKKDIYPHLSFINLQIIFTTSHRESTSTSQYVNPIMKRYSCWTVHWELWKWDGCQMVWWDVRAQALPSHHHIQLNIPKLVLHHIPFVPCFTLFSMKHKISKPLNSVFILCPNTFGHGVFTGSFEKWAETEPFLCILHNMSSTYQDVMSLLSVTAALACFVRWWF